MKWLLSLLLVLSFSTLSFDLMNEDADDFLNDMRSENEILEKMEKEQARDEKEAAISAAKDREYDKRTKKSSRGIASIKEKPSKNSDLPSEEAPSLNGFMDLDF